MPNLYNAGELATIIKKLAAMDTEDLGADNDAQNSYIFMYMNIAMFKLARLANQIKYSDSKTISADGYVTFQQAATDISNMFEPLIVFDPNGKPVQKRTSDDAPIGWYRDAENQEIHIRGFSATSRPLTAGSYQLKYIRYPKKVTITTDTVEFPPSGYDALIKEVLSLIKYSSNSYGSAEYLDGQAKQSYGNLLQGTMSARGTGSTGQPVGENDMRIARGG